MDIDKILEEQIRYYRARATEYDTWFLRQGRFDFGNEWNRQWFSDVEELRRQLKRFQPAGKVLEFAGGTGWWTEELARYADHVTTVDSSPEVLEINRQRNSTPHVRHLEAVSVRVDTGWPLRCSLLQLLALSRSAAKARLVLGSREGLPA